MTALSPGPAEGLVSDFITWGFVAAIIAAWAVVELVLFAIRWRAESRALDANLAVMNEQAQRCAETGRWIA